MLAIWMILVAALLPVGTVGLAKMSALGSYDHTNSRQWEASLTGWRQRAVWAQRNHFEAFPAFAIAVALALTVGVDAVLVNQLAVAFVVARLAYTGVYLAINIGLLRTAVWAVGMAITVYLFVLAATQAVVDTSV